MILTQLNRSVTELKGIGKQKQQVLSNAGINSISDLLMHYPRGYENRNNKTLFASIPNGGYAITEVIIISHQFFGFGSKKTLKVQVADSSGKAELICFGRSFLADKLIPGERFYLAGEFQNRIGSLQSSRFEFEPWSETPLLFNLILPVYPLSANLTQNFFRTTLAKAIEIFVPTIDEDLPLAVLEKYQMQTIDSALTTIHQPENEKVLKQAADSIKFREFFHYQIKNSQARRQRKKKRIKPLSVDLTFQQGLTSRLPFSLTGDQKKVIEEINSDMRSTSPMARLLQGDVGSGKTLVALMAALAAVSDQKQCAILVPTELLAQQHAQKTAELLEPLGIRPALLTGSVSDKARKPLLKALENGEIDIIIGTHALFTKQVQFQNLALVIIDEQHKFGVKQREMMRQKGGDPHLLMMSATPIPRTLAITIHGDIDISELREMPKGREPITTHLTKKENEQKVYHEVLRELEQGHQAYLVYPQIGEEELTENEKSESTTDYEKSNSIIQIETATQAFSKLSSTVFKNYKVALLHSAIEENEKEQIMNQFNQGEIDVLMATTVVEVGIDNPNATAMVIDNAERFGLSTLHQLRGRVGRSSLKSRCFLIYQANLTPEAKIRLRTMKETNDGFVIAQKDLEIRGPGELLGAKQSGQFQLNLANPLLDGELLEKAKEAAEMTIELIPTSQ